MKRVTFFLLAIIFLSSCSPQNGAEEDNKQLLESPSNTRTPVQTVTPEPTITPTQFETSQLIGDLTIIDGFHNVYWGYMGDDEFLIDIFRDNNKLTAVLVKQIDQENEIQFQGEIVNNTMLLHSYENKIEISTIKGVGYGSDSDDIYCIYTSLADNIDTPIILKMLHATGGPLDNRYGNDTQKVENFVKEIKEDVISENKQDLAEKVVYPIEVKVKDDYKTINTADEFLQSYDDIVNETFKKAIQDAYTKFMFHNWNGIMFGNGSTNVWIDSITVDGKDSLKIIGINN